MDTAITTVKFLNPCSCLACSPLTLMLYPGGKRLSQFAPIAALPQHKLRTAARQDSENTVLKWFGKCSRCRMRSVCSSFSIDDTVSSGTLLFDSDEYTYKILDVRKVCSLVHAQSRNHGNLLVAPS